MRDIPNQTRSVMQRHSMALVAAAALLISACAPPEETPPVLEDVIAIEAEVSAAFDAYTAAALQGDVDALADMITVDALFMEPGIVINGRDEYRAHLSAVLAEAEVTHFSWDRARIFVHGDAAYDVGTYEESFTMGGDNMTVTGNFFARWERGADGRWRVDTIVAGPRDDPRAEEM